MNSNENFRNLRPAACFFTFLLIIAGLFIIASCNGKTGAPQLSSPSPITPSAVMAKPTVTSTPPPGLKITGRVVDSTGSGVENVKIYRSYSSYPGEEIATTGVGGYYASTFYQIPGDEMITVSAEKPGLVFEPAYYNWRHYYGFENAECNFRVLTP
jgi:hypothetical protein